MPLILYPIGLWLVLNLGFGAVKLDEKIRCEQNQPLPGQICPEKKQIVDLPAPKKLIEEARLNQATAERATLAPPVLSLPLQDPRSLCGTDGCKPVTEWK